jgi:hypothetical protein
MRRISISFPVKRRESNRWQAAWAGRERPVAMALLFGLASFLVHANPGDRITTPPSVERDFDFSTETMCFGNYGRSRLDREHFGSTGILVLGDLAANQGACHGISKLVASAHKNIRFVCGGPRPSEHQINEAFRKAVYLHDRRCTNRIVLRGACNLRDLCNRDTIRTLRRLAVQANASRTFRDTLPEYLDGNVNLNARSDEEMLRQNYRAIFSIYEKLQEDEAPLIFYQANRSHRGHVVMATGAAFRRLAERDREGLTWTHRVTITVADPVNRTRASSLSYSVNTFEEVAFGGRGRVIRDPEPFQVRGNCGVFDRPRRSEYDIF